MNCILAVDEIQVVFVLNDIPKGNFDMLDYSIYEDITIKSIYGIIEDDRGFIPIV